jgi:hypothetical protein
MSEGDTAGLPVPAVVVVSPVPAVVVVSPATVVVVVSPEPPQAATNATTASSIKVLFMSISS